MLKVISLLASCTEIVCALGFEARLVGRSHECDYPSSVRHLPVCTEPKFDVDGSSYDVDQRVRAVLQEALSVYRVDGDVLRELRPDLILTQTQCEVCAVSLSDVEEALRDWLGSPPDVLSLAPNCLADIWDDILSVAEALGSPARGEELVDVLKGRVEFIEARAQLVTPPWPNVACIEWIEPLMAAGNWVPELVEMAGGWNLFGKAGEHAPWLEWEELVEGDPDVIVVMPCGYDIAKTLEEMPALTSRPGWQDLKAARSGQVYLVDGNQYFNRPGPRMVDSLEILTEIFHPEYFHYGHEGTGWIRFLRPS
jgi:iron complex transport system substrate-binding protein